MLDRIQPLKGPSQIQSEITQLPHNHQKGKQCRACRTLRRISKDNKEKELFLVVGDVSKEVIRGGSEIASNLLQALGQWQRGIGQNPDPVAQGVAIAEQVVIFGVFVATFPRLAHFFGIDSLLHLKGGTPPNFPAIITQANADIATIQADKLAVPSWLTQIANWDQKSLSGLPDLTQPIQLYGSPELAARFRQDILDLSIGKGSVALQADLHELAQRYILFAQANVVAFK